MDSPCCKGVGKSAVYKYFVAAVNVFFILSLISVYQCVMHYLQFKAGASDWSFFEVLTNYEAGFIRRGLLGQLLYWIAVSTHINLWLLISFFLIPSWIFVAVFMLRKFRNCGLRWWLLAIIGFGVLPSVIRKDFVIYALFIAVLYIYRSRQSVAVRISAMSLLSVLMLLIYEPAVFMCLGFVVLVVLRDKNLTNFARVAYPSVICATMLILLKSTGSIGIGREMLSSWHGMIPDGVAISDTVIDSLDWSIRDSIRYNLHILMPEFSLFFLIKYVFIILIVPYIYISYMYVDTYTASIKFPYQPSAFTTLYVFFLICMLPMWVGLSCDYGRMLYHATLSSLCVAFILPQQQTESTFPQWALRIGQKIFGLFQRIPHSIYSITILMLIITPAYSFYYTTEYFTRSESLLVRVLTDAWDMAGVIFSHIF